MSTFFIDSTDMIIIIINIIIIIKYLYILTVVLKTEHFIPIYVLEYVAW